MDPDRENELLDDLALCDGFVNARLKLQDANRDIAFVEAMEKCGHKADSLYTILIAAMELRIKCRELLGDKP
jgi:hypothetical protein